VANSKSHADRFWALALAVESSNEDKQPNIIVLSHDYVEEYEKY